MPKKTRKRSPASSQTGVEDSEKSRRSLLSALLAEALEHWEEMERIDDFRALPTYQECNRRTPRERGFVVLTTLDLLEELRDHSSTRRSVPGEGKVVRLQRTYAAESLLGLFLKRTLEFDSDGLERLVRFVMGAYDTPEGGRLRIVVGCLRAAERHALRTELSADVIAHLRRWRSSLAAVRADRTLLRRFDALIASDDDVLDSRERWAATLRSELKTKSDEAKWWELLRHLQKGSGSRPTARWREGARERIAAVGEEAFLEHLAHWLRLAPQRQARSVQTDAGVADGNGNVLLLRGLVWSCAGRRLPGLQAALGDLGEACFKKRRAPGRSLTVAIGNACVMALAADADPGAFAELHRLRLAVKLRSVQQRIALEQENIAEATGLAVEELEELSVAECGLTDVGSASVALGEWCGEIEVYSAQRVELSWRQTGGRKQKSVPVTLRRDFPERVAQLQAQRRDVLRTLPGQQRRLESLLLSERSWQLEVWRQRYLVQPLVATLGRRLIWSFQLPTGPILGIWHDGQLVDVGGQPIYGFTEETRVRLWHPIGFSHEVTSAWRQRLADGETEQPFKQAHRELYVLTDAELATETYSNRFAAHILKQHQFARLCQARGWQFQMAGHWSYERLHATRELPGWGIRAEFWLEAIHSDEAYTPSGVGLYLSTDQVRFYNGGGGGLGESLALTEVPALVFTEIMRDVDLFVGVASIGNDPGWADHGDDTPYFGYWQDFSFGALGETARTRREVLAALLPRLKIADRCRVEDRFLVVRGDLRTYKIHLGSSNILMEPNDQYLCVVEDRVDAAAMRGVRLPFEGDSTLSMILSKAFLLAADASIQDRTILSQIQ